MIAAILRLTVLQRLPRLHIEGKQFVDSLGKSVALRGVNLGGWLVEETWMTPVQEDPPAGSKIGQAKDHKSLWGPIESRLGKDAMVRVRTSWRENWITTDDFKAIKAMGLNHVRLPFLARLLDEPGGMEWLRRGVRLAKEQGLYVVLDLHGVPGSQSGEHHTGERDKNRFWFEPKYITECEGIWARLAAEFRNEPTVAAYDLINEPMGTPNPATLHLVYGRLIAAIRKVDPAKPVIIDDGYRGFDTTPHADAAGWTQVAYSLHRYNFDAKKEADHHEKLKQELPKLLELQGYRNAPVYIGEFNLEPHGGPDEIVKYAHTMDAAGLSWAVWTYKTANPKGPMGAWGLVSNPGGTPALDPFQDDEATLVRKMRAVRTDKMKPVKPGLQF